MAVTASVAGLLSRQNAATSATVFGKTGEYEECVAWVECLVLETRRN